MAEGTLIGMSLDRIQHVLDEGVFGPLQEQALEIRIATFPA
jgi:hypothetical protein